MFRNLPMPLCDEGRLPGFVADLRATSTKLAVMSVSPIEKLPEIDVPCQVNKSVPELFWTLREFISQ